VLQVDCRTDSDWLTKTLSALRYSGCCVVEGVLAPDVLSETRDRMYAVHGTIRQESGDDLQNGFSLPPAPPANNGGAAAQPIECPAGAAIVFDSTHAAGRNASDRDRLGINLQFTRSFIKQQVDYVRALGDEVVERHSPRTQQLLGWFTRVVASLDEYYQPTERRPYRSGQG
jgi:hypothetical protein